MKVEPIIRPLDTETQLAGIIYIAHGWQMFAKNDKFRTPTVKLARGHFDSVTYIYVGTISLLDEETDGIKVCACYLPELNINSRQAKVFDELVENIQKEYFNSSEATKTFDRNTFHDLMNEIYTSLDDYLCDGAYLNELMQRFEATRADLDELCFMLREIHSK